MFRGRLKIGLKWAAYLVLVLYVNSFCTAIIVHLLAASFFPDGYDKQLIGIASGVASLFITIPFAYLFIYYGVTDYLRSSTGKWEKNIGIRLGIGIVTFAILIIAVINYILLRKIDVSIGLLPLLIGLIAGRNAEAKFLKRK